MPASPYIKKVQATRIKKEIAELAEKKKYVVSITKIGEKENYNVKFKTLYHPNVERGGELCIPMLSLDNWKPATTLEDILMSILQLLVEPDISRPIRFDIAEECVKDPATYKKNASECMMNLPP
ncbi:hypothetical protein V3C99_012125 [Haemonchus contortus]